MAEPLEVLNESTCWQLLRTTVVGRLAIHDDEGGIDIYPVNYVVDHGSVVFRTAAGTKLAEVDRLPQVAFEADNSDLADGVAWSVLLKGTAEMIEGHSELLASFELDVHPWHLSSKPYFVRVVPVSTTGRRFTIEGRRT